MRFFSKILSFVALLFLASCNPSPQPTQIRIVDLQGNPHSVQMRTPELNMQALAAQGNLTEEQIKSQPSKAKENPPAQIASNKYADGNLAGSSSEALQNTLQLSTDPQKPNYDPEAKVIEVDITAGQKNKSNTVEYTLNKDKKDTANSKQKGATSSKGQKGYFVQTGSFSVLQHAKVSLEKVKKFSTKQSKAQIEEAVSDDKTVYRVLIGPFPNKNSAKKTLSKIKKSGHQAIIIKNK